MKPSLMEIAEAYPDLTINVKLSDLLEAFRTAVSEIEKEDPRAKLLISKEEAAKQLNVSCPTLYRREKSGYLIPVRSGRKVLYRQLDIDNLPR